MRVKDFLKTGHSPTLFSATLYFTVSFAVWVLVGVLGAYIAADFGLTASQEGLMVALPLLGGALIRIPLGVLVDRVGSRKMGICLQLLAMIPLIGIWLFGTRFTYVLAFGILLGVAGGSFAVTLPLASRWYPKECQGLALGIVGAGNSGTILASLVAPSLAEWLSWRNVFGVALIPAALTLLLFTLLAKESPSSRISRKARARAILPRDTELLSFCVLYAVTFGGFVGLAAFLGIFFHEQYGVSKVVGGYVTALCVFAGSLARPMGGYLADRVGGLPLLRHLFGGLSVMMVAVAFVPPLAWTTGFIVLGMVFLGMGSGAIFQLVPLRFGKQMGAATGLVGAAGALGGFFLPTLVGFVKDFVGSYALGFALFSMAGLTAWLFLRRMEREWRVSRILQGISPEAKPELILEAAEERSD